MLGNELHNCRQYFYQLNTLRNIVPYVSGRINTIAALFTQVAPFSPNALRFFWGAIMIGVHQDKVRRILQIRQRKLSYLLC